MRYFRNGNRIVRVGTDAPLGAEFLASPAEVYSIKNDKWVPRPGLTPEIVLTGDWDSCTEDEAVAAIKTRQMRIGTPVH
jgi:hypothetical protein